jgi:allantoinase
MQKIASWMAAGPARLAGLTSRKGALIPGADADFVAFDPQAVWTVAEKHLHFRHKLSPYLGTELHGLVEETWLRGEKIFSINNHRGSFIGSPRGKELTRKPVRP